MNRNLKGELLNQKYKIHRENAGKSSVRGTLARRMIKAYNHFPFLEKKVQTGEFRAMLTKLEKPWQPPERLKYRTVRLSRCNAEFIETKLSYLPSLDSSYQMGNESYQKEVRKARGRGMILHLHGGGYYGVLHNTYRDMAARYNQVSGGMPVLSVDYRVAPKHPYPAALKDALEGYKWVLEHSENGPVFIVGDSAGGGLTLALTLYLRDHGIRLPDGIVTMSAWTDLTKSRRTYETNYQLDPVFGGSRETLVYMEDYFRGHNPKNPYISPFYGDYHDFPPMLMQVGLMEMLLDDTLEVAKKAKKAGVNVRYHVYPGMFHDFQMAGDAYREAKEAWNEIGEFTHHIVVKSLENTTSSN